VRSDAKGMTAAGFPAACLSFMLALRPPIFIDGSLTPNQTPQAVPPPSPPPPSDAPSSHKSNAGDEHNTQVEVSTNDDAPGEPPVEPTRSSWNPPPPPPAPEVQKRTQTKEELRREVEVHRVVETQLHGACKVAQVCTTSIPQWHGVLPVHIHRCMCM